mgnify:CR=1 FL=1
MNWLEDDKRKKPAKAWKSLIHEVIFEADSPAGKTFDVFLIISILVSVLIVMLDSISAVSVRYGNLLYVAEWFFTILFTIEYVLRLSSVSRPIKYATSFYGIVDLLAIIPTYLSLFVAGTQYLLVIRVLRILRVFRVFKLVNYVGEAHLLLRALRASRRKISVFLYTVLTLVVVFGALMYMLEGPENGFTSIPRSIYWAIVTLTTVGYGDVTPQTPVGQFLAAIVMIFDYAIIAFPTGIVSVEMAQEFNRKISTQACPACSAEGHDADATHCKYCGSVL